ncbi:MAG: hypothetical protein SRB2_02545 [Desulfobacteraceae bacterium Eth-SRB2]|nr:MAG: hypothetical protein SRB2_02545 [Desulfobacteraceae bacterium Eth-SRB2]
MDPLIKNDQRAFTLLEILAALGILVVILVFFFRLTKSYEGQTAVENTRSRMQAIVESAKAYYLSHGNLPIVPWDVNDDPPGIPVVEAGKLNVDPKFRFDGWQREMRYISYTNDGDSETNRPPEIRIDELSPPREGDAMVVIPVGTRTLIRAIEFEGRRVAGLIISSGPDQTFTYPAPEPIDVDYGYSPMEYRPGSASDDIFMPIDLTAEATQIALAELKALNDKVAAFEDRYLGVDNDGDNPPRYDEAGCRGIPYGVDGQPITFPPGWDECSDLIVPPRPSESFPPRTDRDINCGRPTLDYMKANFCGDPNAAGANCDISGGYYVPEVIGFDSVPMPPTDPNFDPLILGQLCVSARDPASADYARLPFDRGNPQPDDCHWGLVETRYGDGTTPQPNETDGDQARAFIFCLFNLSPDAIVDPWLNGYVWGCGIEETFDTNDPLNLPDHGGCQYVYPVDDSHFRRFFSAGPDGLPALLEAEIETTPEEQAATDDIVS